MTPTTRAQRQRCKGWRAPAGSIYCGRGSRYGNPFRVTEYGRDEALWRFGLWFNLKPAAEQRAILDALDGHTLLCWCKPSDACHVDYYIRLLDERKRFRGFEVQP